MAYTPELRSTGVGVAMAIGRCGSILAPILVGGLLDLGWAPVAMYVMFAVVLLLVAAIGPALPRRQGGRQTTGQNGQTRGTSGNGDLPGRGKPADH